MSNATLADQLHHLRDSYTERVNSVLEEGREDLAHELSDSFTNEALEVIASAGGTTADLRTSFPRQHPDRSGRVGHRGPGAGVRARTRRLLRRADHYTLDTLNAPAHLTGRPPR